MTEAKVDCMLELFLTGNRLKSLQRQGWAMRGVSLPESVAEHSHQMAVVALFLLDACDEELDREKVLTIALLHDMPEVATTDIPDPAVRLLGRQHKRQAEEQALRSLMEGLPGASEYLSWWREFEEASSPEGRLVRDADRLELMLQAYAYERAGHRGLDEFWEAMAANSWYYLVSKALFARLCGLRERLGFLVPGSEGEHQKCARGRS